MKKFLKSLILILTVCAVALFTSSCEHEILHKVSFFVDDNVVCVINSSGYETVSAPSDPVKDGHAFDGWFLDEGVWEQPFTENSFLDLPITDDVNIYAKFVEVHNHYYVEVIVPPTCTEKGYTLHSCTCGDEYKSDYVDEIGHEFINPIYEWKGDSCTAARVCKHDGKHVEMETVVATYVRDTVVDCDSPESGHYEVSFENPIFESRSTKENSVIVGTPLGHNYVHYVCERCHEVKPFDFAEFRPDTFSVDGTNFYGVFSNATTTFDFADEFEVGEGAIYTIYDEDFEESIVGTEVDLEAGDNVFGVTVQDGRHIVNYKVTVRRRPIYTVTFDSKGGSNVESQFIEEGSLASVPGSPAKYGYGFVSWNYDFETPVTGDLTIEAEWEIGVYEITYVYGDGATFETTKNTFTVESEFDFDIPEKDYYDFVEWQEDGVKITGIALGTVGNKTVTAVYTPTVYNIVYELNGVETTNSNPETYTVESEDITFADLVAEDENFKGFFLDEDFETATTGIPCGSHGDVTVYAKWTYNTVTTVTGYKNGNAGSFTALDGKKVKAGEEVTVTASANAGYEFLGWYNGETLLTSELEYTFVMGEEDITLTVNYAPVEYSITVDFKGGAAADGVIYPTVYTIESDDVVIDGTTTPPVKNYYSFGGWSYSESGTDASYSVTIESGSMGDVTLYATWTPISYTVTYKGVEGATHDNVDSYTVESDSFSLSAPSKDGFDFIGWTYEGQATPVTEIMVVKGSHGDKEFTANWLEHYAITYNLDGGTNADSNPAYYLKTTETFSLAAPTKDNCDFLGWTYEGQLTPVEEVTIETGSEGAKEFTANWLEHFPITYNLNGGTNSDKNPTSYTKITQTFSLVAPTKENYDFIGWTYEGQLTPVEEVTIETGSKGAKEFTANWAPTTYDIHYDFGGGSAFGAPTTYTAETETFVLPIPDKIGYMFTGWTYEGQTTPVVVVTIEKGSKDDREFTANWIAETDVFNVTNLGGGKKITGVTAKGKTMKTLVVPSYVMEIADGAFAGCTALEELALPFVGAKKSTTATDNFQYPFGYIFGSDYVEGITATYQSYYGNGLGSTTSTPYYIPESLKRVIVTDTEVLPYAFSSCDKLTEIILIGSSMTNLNFNSFYNCKSLRKVVIAPSVTNIAGSAFYGCVSLSDVILPQNLETIGTAAFDGCASLTSVVIPDKVTTIGPFAFRGCGLVTVTVGKSVNSIGTNAFSDNYKLVEVINESSLSFTVGDYNSNGGIAYSALNVKASGESDIVNVNGFLFYVNGGKNYLVGYTGTESTPTFPTDFNGESYEIYKYAFKGLPCLKEVTVPGNVTAIGEFAFANCPNLERVIIGEGVGSIGEQAFDECRKLVYAKIPTTVTDIESGMFHYCYNLEDVEIHAGIRSIGDFFVYDCYNLKTINFGGTQAQWAAIKPTTSYWNYEVPTGAVVICSDGNVKVR